MVPLCRSKPFLILLVSAVVLAGSFQAIAPERQASAQYAIELEEFRWNVFPLKTLVTMGQWATLDYAITLHEALDDWIASIWNYTQSYNDTSLTTIDCAFYLEGVNSTSDPDVVVSFNRDEMPPYSGIVGLTQYNYEIVSHQPQRPITVNITTYSATATNLFVKDIFMHEYGHVLGLGHASSPNTSNGPELMYESSTNDKPIYPSTLDVYGLTVLYTIGRYKQIIQLPVNIPYRMLIGGNVPSTLTRLWENYKKYLPLLVIVLIIVVVGLVLTRVITRRTYPEPQREFSPPPPPPPPDY